MMRLPFFPTLVVAAAVATMIGLGIWQLQRADWKEGLIARLEAARTLPPVELNGGTQPGLEFRRAMVRCSVPRVKPEIRGGRSRDDQPGFVYLVPCREAGAEQQIVMLDAGWSADPAALKQIEAPGPFVGVLRMPGSWEGISMAHYVLVLDRPIAGLAPSAQPSVENIPNNHRFYAVQWFFFAAAAALIYALALHRRRRGSV